MTFGSDRGWGADGDEARRIFDLYVDRGGNFVDTSVNYTDGCAERPRPVQESPLSRYLQHACVARCPDADARRHPRLAEEVQAVVEEADSTPSRVALAWTLTNPGVVSPVNGARTLAQAEPHLSGSLHATSPRPATDLRWRRGRTPRLIVQTT